MDVVFLLVSGGCGAAQLLGTDPPCWGHPGQVTGLLLAGQGEASICPAFSPLGLWMKRAGRSAGVKASVSLVRCWFVFILGASGELLYRALISLKQRVGLGFSQPQQLLPGGAGTSGGCSELAQGWAVQKPPSQGHRRGTRGADGKEERNLIQYFICQHYLLVFGTILSGAAPPAWSLPLWDATRAGGFWLRQGSSMAVCLKHDSAFEGKANCGQTGISNTSDTS